MDDLEQLGDPLPIKLDDLAGLRLGLPVDRSVRADVQERLRPVHHPFPARIRLGAMCGPLRVERDELPDECHEVISDASYPTIGAGAPRSAPHSLDALSLLLVALVLGAGGERNLQPHGPRYPFVGLVSRLLVQPRS